MTTHEKNATLKPDILQQLAVEAQAQGKTVDDVLDEAARKYLDIKHTITDMDSFVARNRNDAQARGIKDSDVVRLVKESRKENSR